MAFGCVLAVAAGGVAYAAFVATTSSSGNSVAAASSFGRCLVDEVMSDNPAAYWRMDDAGNTLVDRTGNNNGSYATAASVGQPGALGDPAAKSVDFAAAGARAAVSDSTSLRTGDNFTLEAWIKRDSVNARFNTIMFKGGPATSGGPALYIDSSNRLALINNVSPGTILATSSSTVTDMGWHHVAATKSGATTKLYIDGVDRTGTTNNATLPSTEGSPLNISSSGSNLQFGGKLDEIAVHTTALTPARIRAHFDAGRCYRDEPRADDAQAQWRLGESAGAPLTFDSLGSGHGALSGDPALGQPSALDGDSNTATSFDGVNDVVTVADRPGLRMAGNMAVEAWIKPTSLPSASDGFARIIGKGAGLQRNYGLWIDKDGHPLFQQCSTDCSGQDASTVRQAYGLSSTIPTGVWTHLAATVTGNTARVYVNGAEVASQTQALTPATTSDPLTIGYGPGLHGRYNGLIDEAAVYGTSLSPARVRDHYVAGRSYRNVVMDSNPISFWRLGEASGNAFFSEVAGDYGGALQNGYTRGAQGSLAGDANPSTSFNGTNAFGQVADRPAYRLAGNMSIEAWVRPTAAPADYARIFGKGAEGPRNYGLWMDSNRQVFFQQSNAAGSQYRQAGFPVLPLNEWAHLVGTVSGNTISFYLNGQLVGSGSSALTPATNTDPILIGYAGYYSLFSGQIDELALYNRALPADEVATHHAAGIRQPR